MLRIPDLDSGKAVAPYDPVAAVLDVLRICQDLRYGRTYRHKHIVSAGCITCYRNDPAHHRDIVR